MARLRTTKSPKDAGVSYSGNLGGAEDRDEEEEEGECDPDAGEEAEADFADSLPSAAAAAFAARLTRSLR